MDSLQVTNQNQMVFSQEQIEVIKSQIAKDANDLELKSFLWQCQRTGLDPFARQIYFIKDTKGRVQIQTSIDGFRLIAERSGVYEGQTRPRWCGKDGVWKEIWNEPGFPFAAEVGVYKKGARDAIYGIAKWSEYVGSNPGFMWNKMPAHMLAKVAESLALRKAFPNEMSGLYTEEEMGKAAGEPERNKHAAGSNQPGDDEGGGFNPLYIIPFGSLKGSSIQYVLDKSGVSALIDAVEKTEGALERGAIYKGSSVEEMKNFIQLATHAIRKFETPPWEDME